MSMIRALDKRAQRSRERLITAMIQALDSSPEPPSASALVKLAGASRPTLYQHFGDVPTLMLEAAMSRLDEAFQGLEPLDEDSASTCHAQLEGNFHTIFTHLTEHRAFYLAVLNGPSGRQAEQTLENYLTARLENSPLVQRALRENVGESLSHRFTMFLSAGLMAVAIRDLEEGRDAESMTATTAALVARSLDACEAEDPRAKEAR